MAEIEQNPAIASYSDDFNKIFEALYATNETKKELTERCARLEEALAEGTEKLAEAAAIAENDGATIAELLATIERSRRMTDGAHEREQQAQEVMDNLRKQIAALTAEIDFKNKMGSDDADEWVFLFLFWKSPNLIFSGGQASKQQEGLQREKERLMTEVAQLQQKLANALGYQEELERKNSMADIKINEIAVQLEVWFLYAFVSWSSNYFF